VVTFSEKGDAGLSGLSDLKWVLPLLLVIAIIVIVGFIFSITAIIKERTVLSWICFIIYLLPVTIIPVINYLQRKAFYAARYDSPQSQKRREKMYENYNLPDSLDISVRNKFVSANVVDDHYPILSVVNYGNGFWYFLGQGAQIGEHSRFTSFAAMIESDKSVVPLLTTLPAMHYATRKDTKSPWVIGEYHRPSATNEEDNK
jgi:ABC-type multidrug transport system fused ATPase/permease subunit